MVAIYRSAINSCRPSHEGRGLKLQRLVRRKHKPGRPSHEGRGLKLFCYMHAPFLHRSRPSHEGRGLKRLAYIGYM